jgi:hypothetical protein
MPWGVLLRWKKERQHSGHSYSRIWHTDQDFLRQRAGAGHEHGGSQALFSGGKVQATVGAKSGVMRDVPDGGTVLGIPAAPDKQAKRQMIAVKQLPELIRRMRELEKRVEQLSARSA